MENTKLSFSKRIAALFLVFAMLAATLPASVFAAGENVTPSDITQSPKTKSVVTPTDLPSQVTRDVVLLLDVSGSMSGTPMTTMKKAAQKFCSQLLKADGKNRVAIIAFQSSYSTCNFTSDLNTLSSFINSKSAGGGTNMNAAAQAAASLLSKSSAETIKNIVIMADGLPQSGDTLTNGRYSSGSNYKYANAVYNTVKAYDESYKVYTLGFFHSISGSTKDFASTFMSDLASDKYGKYNEVTNVDALEFTFGEVADDITDDKDDKNANCPIIIVPGVMGSKLYDGDTLVWAEGSTNDREALGDTLIWAFSSMILNKLKKLDMDKTLNVKNNHVKQNEATYYTYVDEIDESGVHIKTVSDREYGASDSYKNLVNELCDKFGEQRDIYFFSYDWRQSNADSAEKLKEEIIYVLKDTNYTQVDLVCHSMGGLVASNYVSTYDKKGDTIHKIITCGTPYEGAAKLLQVATTSLVLDGVTDMILASAGLTNEIKKKMPSVAELSPSISYFNNSKTPFVRIFREVNITIDNLLDTSLDPSLNTKLGPKIESKIIQEYCMTEPGYKSMLDTLFGSNAEKAYDTIYKDMNSNNINAIAELDDKAYFVVGIGQKTISSVTFEDCTTKTIKDNGQSCDVVSIVEQKNFVSDVFYDCTGDGTVPYESATMMKKLKNKFGNMIDRNGIPRYIEKATNHGGTAGGSNDKASKESLQYIVDVLGSNKTSVKNDNQVKGETVVIKIACPVDVNITSNGETLNSSKDNMSVLSSFGCLDFLGEYGEIKMLCLDDDNYNITLNGTDDGTMNYTIRWFDENNKLTDERNFVDVPITANTLITTGSDKLNNTVLNIDQNGDGKIDSVWAAKANDEGVKKTITLDRTSLTLKRGEKSTLAVTVSPSDLTVSASDITWTSSDKSVATVSETGEVKGINAGKATITATAENGVSATCEVTVRIVSKYYTVNASSNYGGIVSPKRTHIVKAGNSDTIKISPYYGYKIDSVTVNDKAVPVINNTVTLKNIDENCSVYVKFVRADKFNVTVTANKGGYVSHIGTSEITANGFMKIAVIPKIGYRIKSIKKDGISIRPSCCVFLTKINEDHTVDVEFEKISRLTKQDVDEAFRGMK